MPVPSGPAPITTATVDTAESSGLNVGQIPPVGAHPSASILFIGALLWSAAAHAERVLTLVHDDDMPTPTQTALLVAVRRLIGHGTPPGPQLVADELRRTGTLQHLAARDLRDATTSGAQPMALREYAAAVLAEALRSRIDSAGHALVDCAANAQEDDLAPLVTRALIGSLDCAARLARLRGDAR